jgi:hypothetical protein
MASARGLTNLTEDRPFVFVIQAHGSESVHFSLLPCSRNVVHHSSATVAARVYGRTITVPVIPKLS